MATPTATPSDRTEERDGDITYIRNSKDLPPVAIIDRSPIKTRHKIIFAIIALIGAVSWAIIAFVRGEAVNAMWFVLAALCTYVIAYRFYARLIELKIVRPRDENATPAEVFENDTDYMPTDRRVLFGHHFAAIAGAGPLVGPVLALQMGYLPGTIWIIIGAVLAGCVQDYLVLWISSLRRGRSLGQMVRDEIGAVGGAAAIVAVFAIMIILLAVLALVVVQALGQSSWGVFSIAMTIPIAIFMGIYLRFIRPGRVSEVTIIGVALLLVAVISGDWVSETSWGTHWFGLSQVAVSWCIIVYGLAASVLPVWLLLAPRDYLSTFMKVGTIALLAIGILVARPVMQAPAISKFAISGTGPSFAGSLFPFLFITIACGALSGFHSLISSGTTPKMLEKQSQMRLIGYGGMLVESFVGIMALTTAAILDQHLYFAMNAPLAKTCPVDLSLVGRPCPDPQQAATYVNGLGLSGKPASADQISQAARAVGEHSIISRTGGAPTLAVGISDVLERVFGGRAFEAFWYHFAIMFEALFILTTVDAGTRVARFMLSDGLSNLGGPLRKLRNPSWRIGAWSCSVVVVALWGSVLLMGVTDPLGGINTLFPLFGIANQLLAAVALTVVSVVVVKKGYLKWLWIPAIPLLWDLTVTLTASWQKIFSGDPNVGYWTQHHLYLAARAAHKTTFGSAKNPHQIDAVIRNTFIDGTLSVVFAVLVIIVFVTGVIMAIRVIRGGGSPLSEDEPVPSKLFAPTGLIPTAPEREVQRQWDALPESHARPSLGSHARSPGTAKV